MPRIALPAGGGGRGFEKGEGEEKAPFFSPPRPTPAPPGSPIWAVVCAQYLLTRPQLAAGPLITPSTPILSVFSALAVPTPARPTMTRALAPASSPRRVARESKLIPTSLGCPAGP